MMKLILSAIAVALALPVAHAQIFVVGGALGRDCYDAARKDHLTPKHAEKACTSALGETSMTRKNRAATYVNRGIIRMRATSYQEALEDYSRATELNPDLGEAYVNRGAVLIYQGKYKEALAALDRGIALAPAALYAAHYNRAIARESRGDVAGAYADFKKAAELRPDWELVKDQLSRFRVG